MVTSFITNPLRSCDRDVVRSMDPSLFQLVREYSNAIEIEPLDLIAKL